MGREDPVTDGAAFTAAGDAALEAGDWSSARDAFQKALALGDTPEALDGLGETLWWLGETSASIDFRERAYSAFRARPDPGRDAAARALPASVVSFYRYRSW